MASLLYAGPKIIFYNGFILQCGQIWKFSAINFLSKVAQIFGDILGHFENTTF